ncbi:protein phosphatase 2, regulatory subunit B'', alpha isoform X4 [Mucor ambiguus]|uniref:Protein phosphatase 2, regulatory subunit B'', alpha isoform X4 n=1 Tax=Mucor ambiguus TaxID=91626 RepID=A0A0C9MIL2_9FUNG|nr:protein phosphatase 2, regulatory subunit B'', alpha isoform X4 [Mucor ambiguus]
MPSPSTFIPQFYFPKADKRTNDNQGALMVGIDSCNTIKEAFYQKEHLTELEFLPVTTACALPQYMNLALFRAIDMLNDKNDQVTFAQFQRSWPLLTQEASVDDIHSLMYTILKKPELNYLTPDDFLPVLEDIVLNHPALQFLENNITFQERYIETVICRIYYDAHCPSGRLTFHNFKKSGIAAIIQRMTPSVDLYTIHNLFSYKQFYVLYCKLWSLDRDHDLAITETDLCNYNMGALTRLAVERIMEVGHIAAFADTMVIADNDTAAAVATVDSIDVPVQDSQSTLTYFDFIWFLLSEVDKSTPMAIRCWFRCLDIDDDGILSSYELSQFWQDQNIKQQVYSNIQSEDRIQFADVMRQMNDLIRPQVPGQFTMQDLKKNVFLAERFFDTFINFDRFQAHESRPEGSIREQQIYQNKLLEDAGVYGAQEPVVLTDDFGFPILSNWNDYADLEYRRIIVDENYANSYEAEDVDTDNDILAADEGLFTCKPTNESTTQMNATQTHQCTLYKQDQDQDGISSLTSEFLSDADEAPLLSEKTTSNTFADAETDSNDDDDFEDACTPNSPCIFTPKPLAGSENDSKSSPPITDALTNTTTTSYLNLTTRPHHHQQRQQNTVSLVL